MNLSDWIKAAALNTHQKQEITTAETSKFCLRIQRFGEIFTRRM